MKIDVIATTISGSISDWKKIEQIKPLFAEHGFNDVTLHSCDTHSEARQIACNSLLAGGRRPISAGGSGTFRSVMEGCLDSSVPMDEIRLGFLRKGSADLIGKVLKMPDNIDDAISVFATSLKNDTYLDADLLFAKCPHTNDTGKHFIGYGGVGLFGRIPHFTENRHMKWYKGLLSQFFGDLGPFTTGMILSLGEQFFRRPMEWIIEIDGAQFTKTRYHALILANGYLGPDMSFSDKPLNSRCFQLFGLRDIGKAKLMQQAMKARSGKILENPKKWGFDEFTINEKLILTPDRKDFPVNIDGSTMPAEKSIEFSRVGAVPLLCK
ncbi:hypothetical protein HN388_02600 [bacterium]|jgi:diacylglycerol kinase family enzyme|nr:hypothetical protein [bacterium]